MPIKIKIVELGPIRDSEIEFHPFLLFTGESNTGKSYTALLIYSIVKLLETKTYFKQFEQMIFNYEIRDNSINYRIKPEYFSNFYNDNIPNYFSYLIGNKHANCKIQVFIDSQEDYFLEINESSVYIKDSTLNTLDKLSFDNIFSDKRFDYIIEQSENSVFNKFINEFKLIINKSFILPPGRGVLVDSSYSIKKGTSNAGMYENFLEDLDLILSPSFNNEKKNNKFLDELLSEIFKGYFRKDGDRIYYKTKSFDIPLTSSASSIKELSPLYFILKKFPIDKTFLFIEEPESHIHPELQRKVARLLAYMVNQNGMVLTTTHSDYFINQINNLIKLDLIKKRKNSKTKYNELMKMLNRYGYQEELVFPADKVGAYYFERQKDGTVRIKKRELNKEAIPFDTFKHTVDSMLEENKIIDGIFYE